jgi:hypothetical protein
VTYCTPQKGTNQEPRPSALVAYDSACRAIADNKLATVTAVTSKDRARRIPRVPCGRAYS